MIRDHLVPALKQQFPQQPFIFSAHPAPIATIEAPCVEIGPLSICDDGDEVTIYIDHATHSHFGCYDENLTEEEKEKKIAEEVIEFLSALFVDRVVVFRIFRGWAGGWRMLKPEEKSPRRSFIWQQFLWSKPLQN
jgi:hypothetical protein